MCSPKQPKTILLSTWTASELSNETPGLFKKCDAILHTQLCPNTTTQNSVDNAVCMLSKKE